MSNQRAGRRASGLRGEVESLIASCACPALVTDERGRLFAVNEAAESYLALGGRSTCGRTCQDLLSGHGSEGLLAALCASRAWAARGERIGAIPVEDRAGHHVMLFTAVLRARRRGRFLLLHVIARNGAEAPVVPTRWRAEPAPAPPATVHPLSLTARELQVLRFLWIGAGCQEIADRLCVSLSTVRNHVQHILRKLDVHSQIEAVALAHREGLV